MQEIDYSGVHEYPRDKETVKFMTWGPKTPGQTRNFIRQAAIQKQKIPRENFLSVVTLREIGDIIGGCGIHIRSLDDKTAVVGYCFNRKFWGQGYATVTLGELLKFCLEQLKLHRIIATCDTRNIGSRRVMEKNMMRREAHFIQNQWQKGHWRDSYLYAILKSEW